MVSLSKLKCPGTWYPKLFFHPFFPFQGCLHGCSLEPFSLGLDVFLSRRQSGSTQRCSINGLTLSSPCPWPPLGPTPSCCLPSLPPRHHPGYHSALGYAFPWQRDVLEDWKSFLLVKREISHPWSLCAFFLRIGL